MRIILLLAYTGMRVGEVLALEASKINLHTSQIRTAEQKAAILLYIQEAYTSLDVDLTRPQHTLNFTCKEALLD